MIEINSDYFSSIGRLVNQSDYNCHTSSNLIEPIFANELNKSAIKLMLDTDGFCVINFKEANHPEPIEKYLNDILGNSFNDKNPDKLAYAKVQVEENAKFYINSNLAQPIHTDEGYTTKYPRYVGLYCQQAAKIGGDSVVVPLGPLLEKIKKKFGQEMDLLFDKNSLTVQNAVGKETKPVLFHFDNEKIGISYSSILKKMWCKAKVFDLYNYITRYVHDINNQLRFRLETGSLLLLDNCRTLHGRTSFSKDEKRLLYRYWFCECEL